MKREVVCLDCAADWKRIHEKAQSEPLQPGDPEGEGLKLVEGKANQDFICDDCNKALAAGTTVVALSNYTARNPYFEWEHEVLEPER